MDKKQPDRSCSPYLRRPLRSLDQALRDHAEITRLENERLLAKLKYRPLAVLQPTKKAS